MYIHVTKSMKILNNNNLKNETIYYIILYEEQKIML